ncbi:phage tail terminator-like protein [Methylotenera sp.]|uniref:phage tail terminator-like protein n=1 Tax=Methylotenera sp. TaxID=2051956 RepID=UPI002489D22C|nr:phage tail terminator-like protein [Methylotenera sp.]MDI1362513.1 phage tail terminator-like protein [Methylotenera sp.]
MSKEFIRSTVFAYFAANFTSAEVEYENLHTIEVSTRTTPFVDLSLRFIGNSQISLGNNSKSRQRGTVQAQVYVKEGKGSKVAYTLSDQIEALFMRKTISGIVFETPSVLTPVESSGWYRATIRCPYYFDY